MDGWTDGRRTDGRTELISLPIYPSFQSVGVGTDNSDVNKTKFLRPTQDQNNKTETKTTECKQRHLTDLTFKKVNSRLPVAVDLPEHRRSSQMTADYYRSSNPNRTLILTLTP